MKKAKNISDISVANMKKRLDDMSIKGIDPFTRKVFISPGNMKTGSISSVSLRPVADCGNCKCCSGKCYDMRNDCVYKGVRATRANNAAIYLNDPKRYFDEISDHCRTQVAFRWHIGGDIKDRQYLDGMIRVANENPKCDFLCFTKMFRVVNEYLDETGGVLPENMQIIFSGWKGLEMDNPYNLPTSHPIFADGSTSAPDGAKSCGGNCTECYKEEKGCWTLKRGEAVLFAAH